MKMKIMFLGLVTVAGLIGCGNSNSITLNKQDDSKSYFLFDQVLAETIPGANRINVRTTTGAGDVLEVFFDNDSENNVGVTLFLAGEDLGIFCGTIGNAVQAPTVVVAVDPLPLHLSNACDDIVINKDKRTIEFKGTRIDYSSDLTSSAPKLFGSIEYSKPSQIPNVEVR